MQLIDVMLSAGPGDIAVVNENFFYITDYATEPSHPAAPGLVWHGYYWRGDQNIWGAPTKLHLYPGKLRANPELLTNDERKTLGWT